MASSPRVGARLSIFEPSTQRIRKFVRTQRNLDFNYGPIAATRDLEIDADGSVVGDFNVDAVRAVIGRGADDYQRAVGALRDWKMFDLGWVQLCWPDTRICAGSSVAVLAHIARGWVLNASRIVYVIEDSGEIERYGFAYGTLPGHILRGEEKFVVSWNRQSGEVAFELIAISRPNQIISWLSYPLIRTLQRRFRREAVRAMKRSVEG